MKWFRFQLVDTDDEYQIDLDILLEPSGIINRTITFHGVWRSITSRGAEVYPFTVSYDGTVDYGAYAPSGERYAKFAIHGHDMRGDPVVVYEGEGQRSLFEIRQLDPIAERLIGNLQGQDQPTSDAD